MRKTSDSVPIGYLITTALMATCVLLALGGRRPRRSSPFRVSFGASFLVNEFPVVAFGVLVASTALAVVQSGVGSTVFWVAFGLAVVASGGLVVIVPRALRTGAAVYGALNEGLGADWPNRIDAALAARFRRRPSLARALFGPFLFRRHDVQRIANIRYGDAGRKNLLDVYRHPSHPLGCPVLIHFHGGGFTIGRKSREARPLFHRLASQGWVCISANYRLRPAARFPDQLIDVKKVIVWLREHGREYGADPTVVFVAGSSAGGHLASLAALTPNDPAFQPGFESADTSVTAAIALYGYYGSITSDGTPSSPLAYITSEAPPFFVAHGDQDTYVIVDDARRFVERLRSASSNAVVYAELPGAEHGFDYFPTIRFEAVVHAIEAFAAWVLSTRDRGHFRSAGARYAGRRPEPANGVVST
jgi:acetyl esterase/lipase